MGPKAQNTAGRPSLLIDQAGSKAHVREETNFIFLVFFRFWADHGQHFILKHDDISILFLLATL